MDDKEDNFIKTYICTLGYWCPDASDEINMDRELDEGDMEGFEKEFNEGLKNDIINTVKNTKLFTDVKFKFQNTNDTSYNLETYNPNKAANFIYFQEIVIECFIAKDLYKYMLKKDGNDLSIVNKLREKIENALFESYFRNVRVDINLNEIKEFNNKYAS